MSLTVAPNLFAPTFLASPSSGFAQETLIRSQFAQNSLSDQFRALTELQYLYFRNRNAGGRDGMAWVEDTRRRLLDDIHNEQRYREFVSFREDGTAFAEFPSQIAPPPILNFSEEWGRPEVIPLSSSSRLQAMELAYFSLGAIRFLETDVDWDEIDRASAALKNGKKSAPIPVAVSPDRTRFFAGEDLSRSLAVYLTGIPYILGRVNEGYPGNQGLSLSQILTAPKGKPVDEIPLAPIATELSFQPRFDAEFPPVRTLLRRGGRPCPVIVERFLPEDAALLPADLRTEMLQKLASEKDVSARPFFRALRTLDGDFQALSLSFLVPEAGGIRMRCDRTVKRDLDSRNRLEGVGLAFLLSGLQFMKRSGHWHASGDLLYNLIPRVADAIRRQAGFATSGKTIVSVALDGFSAHEGDEILRKMPLKFAPALPSSTAAAATLSETILVDGRAAG